ncbi:MAG: hypothetical protein JXO72_05145 [Vicinamibacteria bacterium]|nr:hypothetical protein [Vicinamibacteria bacterium]
MKARSALAASAALLLLTAGCSYFGIGRVAGPSESDDGIRRRVEVIAHRGFSGAAPENTLAAIREAIAAGADRVEFDVHLTADGEPVVIHDSKLDRTTDGKGPVAAHTLAEVRTLDAGAWFAARYRGERVPTLEEALVECRGRILVNVEIKSEAVRPGFLDLAGIEAKVVDAIRAHNLASSAVVSSFQPIALKRVRRLAPEIEVQSLWNEEIENALSPAQVCGAVGARAFNCSEKQATPERIAAAHAAGLVVNIYTIDEPKAMRDLVRRGADGIITNRPDLLLTVLGRTPVK